MTSSPDMIVRSTITYVLLTYAVYVPSTARLKPTLQLSSVNTTLTQPWHAGLGHLRVMSVETTDEPVTHDFL